MPSPIFLPQLVDLSIGTPEIGAVNFNALHQLLHLIVKKLNLSEHEVNDAFSSTKPENQDRNGLDNSLESATKEKKTRAENKREYKVMQLQQKVEKLESDLNKLLNPTLPDAEKMSSLIKAEQPIADLWHYLSLSKKVEANEGGVKSAINLIQQNFAELKRIGINITDMQNKMDDKTKLAEEQNSSLEYIGCRIDHLDNQLCDVTTLRSQLDGLQTMLGIESPIPDRELQSPSTSLSSDSHPSPSRLSSRPPSPCAVPLVSQSINQSPDTTQTRASHQTKTVLPSVLPTETKKLPTSKKPEGNKSSLSSTQITPQNKRYTSTSALSKAPDQSDQLIKHGRKSAEPRQSSSQNVPKLSEIMKKLVNLEAVVEGYPRKEEFVTWPHLEDALNGVRGEIGRGRKRSPAPYPQKSTAGHEANKQILSKANPEAIKQAKMEKQAQSRPVVKPPTTLITTTKPSIDMLDMLENLGSLNSRFSELTDKVQGIGEELTHKADLDEVGKNKISPELLQQIQDMAADLDNMDQVKTYLQQLDVLLADIPLTNDKKAPVRGDKSRASAATYSSLGLQSREPSQRAFHVDSLSSGLSKLSPRSMKDQYTRSLRNQATKSSNPQLDEGHVTKDGSSAVRLQNPVGSARVIDWNPSSYERLVTERNLSDDHRSRYAKPQPPQKPQAESSMGEEIPRRKLKNLSGIKGSIDVGNLDGRQPSTKTNEIGASNVTDDGVGVPSTADDNQENIEGRTSSYRAGPDAKKGDRKRNVHIKPPTQDSKEVRGGRVYDPSRNESDNSIEPELMGYESDTEDEAYTPQPDQSATILGDGWSRERPQDINRVGNKTLPSKGKGSRKEHEQNKDQAKISGNDIGKSKLSGGPKSYRRPASPRIRDSQYPGADDFGEHVPTAVGADETKHRRGTRPRSQQESRTAAALIIPPRRAVSDESPAELSVLDDERECITPDSKLRQLYDQKKATKEMIRSEQSQHEPKKEQSNLSDPPYYEIVDSQSTSNEDATGRFNTTLREIMYGDYMSEIKKLQRRLDKVELKISYSVDRDSQPIVQYIGGLEDDRLDRILHRMDGMKDDLNKRLKDMDDELYTVLEHGVGDGEQMQKIQVALGDLQSQLEAVRDITGKLQTENEQKTLLMQSLKYDSLRLGEEKADKKSISLELDLKASANDVDTKIGRAEFETITFDLQGLIDDLLNKLLALENAWRKAHTKLESDVALKSAKEEVDRLKKNIERKMKELSHKVKQQQSLLNPSADDAAGMKRKLPLNCLSCDKPVAGISVGPNVAYGDYFSPSRAGQSSSNYTTTEIEQIRHQTKSMIHSDSVMEFYPSPRSCGGSHTLRPPHRGLNSRSSTRDPACDESKEEEHFILPDDDRGVVGADGNIYRASLSARKKATESKLPVIRPSYGPQPRSLPTSERPHTGHQMRQIPRSSPVTAHESPQ